MKITTGFQISVYPDILNPSAVHDSRMLEVAKAVCELLVTHCQEESNEAKIEAEVLSSSILVHVVGFANFIPGELYHDLMEINKPDKANGMITDVRYFSSRAHHSQSGRSEMSNSDAVMVEISEHREKFGWTDLSRNLMNWDIDLKLTPANEEIVKRLDTERDQNVVGYIIRVMQTIFRARRVKNPINVTFNDTERYLIVVDNFQSSFDLALVYLLYSANDPSLYNEKPLECVQLHLQPSDPKNPYRLVVSVLRSSTMAEFSVRRVVPSKKPLKSVSRKRERDDGDDEEEEEAEEVVVQPVEMHKPIQIKRARRLMVDTKA